MGMQTSGGACRHGLHGAECHGADVGLDLGAHGRVRRTDSGEAQAGRNGRAERTWCIMSMMAIMLYI